VLVALVGLVAHLEDDESLRLRHQPKRKLECVELVLKFKLVDVIEHDDEIFVLAAVKIPAQALDECWRDGLPGRYVVSARAFHRSRRSCASVGSRRDAGESWLKMRL